MPLPQLTPNLKWSLWSAVGGLFAALSTIAYFYAGSEPAPVVQSAPPAAEQLYGWAGPEVAAAAYEQIKDDVPTFRIVGAFEDDPTQTAKLWEVAKRNNGGQHLPRFRQEIGDCVGAGGKQCTQYLMCCDPRGSWKSLFVPYHYACGRMAPDCGAGNIRGPDGSVGSWQARAMQLYGVIPDDLPGLPAYSAAVARQWAVRMPAPEWIEQGRMHPVKTVARAESAADVRRGLQNRYPSTIASNYGTETIRPIDGLQVARWDANWPHQMCVIGYCQVGGRSYYYILNSWGDSAHPPPLNDEPPGGFWIPEADLERIVRQGDTWIYSDAVGFPARPLFPIFGDPVGRLPRPPAAKRRPTEHALSAAA